MATATYDLIASQTLGSAASSITFSSIAASWTDLRVVVAAKGFDNPDSPRITLNGDSANNYSYTWILGYNTGKNSGSAASQGYLRTTPYYGVSTASIPFMFTIDIFSYLGSTYKTVLTKAAVDLNNTNSNVVDTVGLYRSTSAITSITISSAGNNYLTNSIFSLYGIKAA